MKTQNALSPKGEGTRDRVLAYAKQLFVNEGYDALILRRIAESLDMKLSNVQYYFPTKEELVTAIIESEERFDIDVLRSGLDRFAEGEDVVRHVVGKLLAHWRGKSSIIFTAREFFAKTKPAIRLTKKENDAAYVEQVGRLVARFRPDLDKDELRRRRQLVVTILDGASVHTDASPRDAFARLIEDLIIRIARDG